jgi:hypothetical protein
MICCTEVCLPVGVNTIRGRGVGRSLIPHLGRIEPLEALENRVVRLATQLAWWEFIPWLVWIAAATATSTEAASGVATATAA